MVDLPLAGFQLVLLGRFELSGPDGAISVMSKKVAALLALLACTPPRPHARDRLMTLLWGSHFDAQARQNLRQALTRLRRILGKDALVTVGETVALRPGVVASDVARFEELLGDGSGWTSTGAAFSATCRSRRRPGPNGWKPSVSVWKAWRSMPWSNWASGIFSSAITGRPAKPPSGRSP